MSKPLNIPYDAACRRCGYLLRELSTSICPECGQAFDAEDPKTMYFGRPSSAIIRAALLPISKIEHSLIIIECFTMLWGMAWLPGAIPLARLALRGLLTTLGFIGVRLLIRFCLERRYPRARLNLSPPYRWPKRVIRTLVIITAIEWCTPPGWVTLQLSRPYLQPRLRRAYEAEPLIFPTLRPGLQGLFWVSTIQVAPRGITLFMHDSGTVSYDSVHGLRLDYFETDSWPPATHAAMWSVVMAYEETKEIVRHFHTRQK